VRANDLAERGLHAEVGQPAQVREGLLDAPAGADPGGEVYTAGSGALTFLGHGFGYGVGLSEYGALGRGRAGQSLAQILDFYYPGTAPRTLAPATTVRVLYSGTPVLGGQAGLAAHDRATGGDTPLTDATARYRVTGSRATVGSRSGRSASNSTVTGRFIPAT
jgi:hypothetical protein